MLPLCVLVWRQEHCAWEAHEAGYQIRQSSQRKDPQERKSAVRSSESHPSFFYHNKQLNNVCEADDKSKQKLSLRLELFAVVCTECRFGIGYSVRVPHRSVPEPFTKDKPDDPQKVVSITLFGQIDLGPPTLNFCRPRLNAQAQLVFFFFYFEIFI